MFFLSAEPDQVHLTAIDTIETGEDSVRLIGSNAYVHYPNGVMGATLDANALDRMLQVASTSRNWRTVTRLAEMANV